MIKEFKNRAVDYSRPVKVYRNLSKKCWSLKQGGVVVAHADQVLMTSEKFTVNLKSRDRGLSEGKKYVHAFIVGFLADKQTTLIKNIENISISYNPVYAPYFYLNYGGYKYCIDRDRKINVKLNLDSLGIVHILEGEDFINKLISF